MEMPGDTDVTLDFQPRRPPSVTCSFDGKLKLWDVASGQELYALADTTDDVRGLEQKAAQYGTATQLEQPVFSPTGDRLAAGCINNVLLWNIAPVIVRPEAESR